jgi:hypothetical protein
MNLPTKDLLTIHADRLDEDCDSNPKLAFEWGEALAEARKNTSLAKNNLKLIAAELDNDIRSNPAKFDLEKATDKAVEACVLTQICYQNAQQELIDAEYEEAVLQAFVFAVSDRKQQITNRANLHGQQYWSKPNMTEESKKRTREEVQQEADKAVNKRRTMRS